jgi:hypothetical protein
VPDTNFDEQSGTVTLEINIEEGKQFRYGALSVEGEGTVPGAKKRLLDFWKPHEGAIYDCGRTLQVFLREIGSRPGVRPEEVFTISQDHTGTIENVEITLADPPIF